MRDDLAGDADALTSMIVENVQRAGLTPLEEARAFGRLRNQHDWSQRQIAKATGVSPGQVHKRLQLLRLPTPVAAALDQATLTVSDALTLLELPDEQLEPAWAQAQAEKTWRDVAGVVAARLADERAHRATQRVRTDLAAAGVQVVDDLDAVRALLGPRAWAHHLPDTTSVTDLHDPADTIAHVHRHGDQAQVVFYTRTPPPDDEDDDADPGEHNQQGASGGSTTAEWERVDAARREHHAAAQAARQARAQACRRLLTTPLAVELVAEILADAVLTDQVLESYAIAETAADWCGAGDQVLDENGTADADAVDAWLLAQGDTGGGVAHRAAVAVALADLEFDHGAWIRPWTPRLCRHVRRLITHAGYQPTAYDTDQLTAADTTTTAVS